MLGRIIKYISTLFFAIFAKITVMETFYHGTARLFDKFDLSHALEGDGKVKFLVAPNLLWEK